MEQRNIEEIVLSKVAGQQLTSGELALFDDWYAEETNRLHYESLLRVRSGVIASEAANVDREKAWKRVSPPAPRLSAGKRAMRYAAAIALPLLIGTAYLAYHSRQASSAENDTVKPGSAMAILTSPSGQRLVFSATGETNIDNGSGVINIKELESLGDGSEIVYDDIVKMAGLDTGGEDMVYSTLEIPRGGCICYVLSDGSKVWLNSESRLRFPMTFPAGVREVELEGEAYFQVAKDARRPFIVRTDDYDIRVTGTQFNVNSYRKGATATTLVEGGVEIGMNGTLSKLTPGHQAVLADGRIEMHEVNIGRYVAWKHNEFNYSRTPLVEIMDELARWYDIEVVWKDEDAKKSHYSAGFSRQSDIDSIIEVLKKTNSVDMTLKGRTLTIKTK